MRGGELIELNSINNNGLAVGELLRNTSEKNSALFSGTVYENGTFTKVTSLPNADNGTRLTGINDSGTYV